MTTAQLIGVGVGPGDPELLTMKAYRLIQQADVITFICNEKGESQAKMIAADALADVTHTQAELPIVMPMSEDRTHANAIYDKAAAEIEQAILNGKNVVFLCEGDPLFFGSFAYVLIRLQDKYTCEVVPGISSVHAAASALHVPLTMLKETFAVVSGRHEQEELVETLTKHDSVVIMKAGRSRQKIIAALRTAHRIADAQYIEYIGRDNEMIVKDVRQLDNEAGPYFSLFVVTPQQRDCW